MVGSFFLVLAASLIAAATAAMPHYVFCVDGIDVSQAQAAPSDVIDIYYMQGMPVALHVHTHTHTHALTHAMPHAAPAFEGAFGDLFKSIGGYHTGLGIINRSQRRNFTLQLRQGAGCARVLLCSLRWEGRAQNEKRGGFRSGKRPAHSLTPSRSSPLTV